MTSNANSTDEYIAALPEERKEPISKLRQTILKNLPNGFTETMGYGMLCYVVPHSKYPDGYHCDPKEPLPFASLASQKNFIAFYHMGMYVQPGILKWFRDEYPKHSAAKLDMGKSCVRFKKPEDIPYKLIGELLKKISVNDWINIYETQYKNNRKRS